MGQSSVKTLMNETIKPAVLSLPNCMEEAELYLCYRLKIINMLLIVQVANTLIKSKKHTELDERGANILL